VFRSPRVIFAQFVFNRCSAITSTSLVVVDDVLTTGAHFKAMQRILNERFPDVSLIGVFVARRVPVRPIPVPIPVEGL
jgi:hypoxanthine-guanine phosphoribosyltransferase